MYDLAGKHVFVSGITGFVGANLARELLVRQAHVHGLVRPQGTLWRIRDILPQLTIHVGDLNELDALVQLIRQVSPEVIFHLAAPGGHPRNQEEREELLRTAVIGTNNLLEAALEVEYHRFVYMCSSLVYGQSDKPLKETDPLRPITFRGVAKAGSAMLCQQHAIETGRPLIILRPFSIYGYWEAAKRLIPTAILAALLGREIALTKPGFQRDLIFVSDVVSACLLALKATGISGEIVNIGSGVEWSNETVVEMVHAMTGRSARVLSGVYPAQPSDTGHWVAAIQKAKDLLGWTPVYGLAEGLRETISWFEKNLELFGKL